MIPMTEQNKSFLEVLSAALRGEFCPKPEETQILEKARVNGINPLIANALLPNGSLQNDYVVLARQLTVGQAQRTADFLLLLKRLEACGLRPVVVKGIVCRSLYPEPELRHSADEDLLIRPDDLARYASVLENEAYLPEMEIDDQADEYEYKFRGKDTQLLIELHTSLFPVESGAYGDCARFFTNALDRAVDMTIEGLHVRTLAPTDHLLYLLCHAYKHLLHSGIGIRQVCDIALMSEKYRDDIDWSYIRASCDSLHITCLCSALFQICEKHFGYRAPESFADCKVDEEMLLDDILSGGRFSDSHLDRAHSSTMTLEAVSADRGNRRRKGALHSVFLPLASMRGQFPYLRKYPWLLPAAWTQRIFRYLTRKGRSDPVNPARSVQIARERIELLREYRIIR